MSESTIFIQEPFDIQYTGQLMAGVDEAGRGPLAGNVVAAAVILDPKQPIEALNDSKKLSEKKREQLEPIIKQSALAWAVAIASPEEIDELNILHASMLAMKRAVEALALQPEYVLVDGNRLPQWHYPSEPVVKGDARIKQIAAASILAKVARDREMIEADKQYPVYGFAQHKGYPTKLHMAKVAEHGACPLHRKSFAPVAKVLAAR